MRVDDSRIRKEKVADSKISGYVWTGSKGAFTRQSKNGTDPTKTGTVPTVFGKKQ